MERISGISGRTSHRVITASVLFSVLAVLAARNWWRTFEWGSRERLRYSWALQAWCRHNIKLYEAGADWDDEWRSLEDDLTAAAAAISGRSQRIIDRRVFRKLDYFRRTGQR